jgi:hypothetical protein
MQRMTQRAHPHTNRCPGGKRLMQLDFVGTMAGIVAAGSAPVPAAVAASLPPGRTPC